MNLPSNTADRQFILPGQPEITVVLRPSLRARRLSLRISRLKGQVTLSLPQSCPMVQAEIIILAIESWIRAHLADLLLETFDASGIALHGGLNRRIRDAQMIAFGQDQASIRLFDPHLGAMAGVNQKLLPQIVDITACIGPGIGALIGTEAGLNRACAALQSLRFVVDQVPLAHP